MMTRQTLQILTLLALLSPLTGCYNQRITSQDTFTRNSPYAVLDTPRLRQLKSEAPPPPADQAWWSSRNDYRLSVNNGPRPVEIIDYQIRVRDYERSSPGRVRHNVNRTTYSTRYGRIVR